MITLHDRLTLDSVRETADGYLAADVRVARTGIQEYSGREIDPDNVHGLRDKAIVRVYRPADEVFAAAALKTYAHRPVTIDHPSVAVDADTWRQHAVGHTGSEVVRDGEFIRVPMLLMDRKAIDVVKRGKREISMGYSTEIKIGDGVTPTGETYDAIQTSLRMNHVAIVSKARGGSDLKLDSINPGGSTVSTRTIIIDGLPVDATDKDAAIVSRAIASRDAKIAEVEKAAATLVDAHAAELAKRDAEIAKRDSEIADLKKRVLDDAALDARVAARSALIDRARKLAPSFATDGLADAAIRSGVLAAVRGADFVKDKSVAYIDAAFDMLDGAGGSDPVRSVIASGAASVNDAASLADKARVAGIADLNAWRNKSA